MAKGIGPKKAEQLKRLRIDTVEHLAKVSAKRLSAKTGSHKKQSVDGSKKRMNSSKKHLSIHASIPDYT